MTDEASSRPAGGDAHQAYRFTLVGPFSAWIDGEPVELRDLGSRKGRTVLKALLLGSGEVVSVDRLREILWDTSAPPNAERNIASLISRLRSRLGANTIEGGATGYRLPMGRTVSTDLHEAERLAGEVEARLGSGQPAVALAAARRGLEVLGEGDLLEDEPDRAWATTAQSALVGLRRALRCRGADAALAVPDATAALALAEDAVRADPLDETACRALMQAAQLAGETARGVLAFEALRAALAEELGVVPSAATRAVHLALLREELPSPTGAAAASTASSPHVSEPASVRAFVGRDVELTRLDELWETAVAGEPSLVLVIGEAGIGKTALVERFVRSVETSGGLAVRARCHAAERSLFLGPLLEALTQVVGHTPPDRLREAVGGGASAIGALVPDAAAILRPTPHETSAAAIERLRTFEAIASTLRRLSLSRPLVLSLDDLHNAGSSTLECVHYLLRHATGGRLLVVATLRVEEGAEVLRELGEVAERLDLGPLPEQAVAALAEAAGAGELVERILSSTRGHTLSVVETLAAMTITGDHGDGVLPPVPSSLESAVLARVERAGEDVAELLRAGAVIGTTFDLTVVADLLELSIRETSRRADRAARARLLVEDGERYAFGNDLIRELVYRAISRPTRRAYHRRAAALLVENPEAVGVHSSAAGDHVRAAAAWLDAAMRAAERSANRDAERLLDRSLHAAEVGEDGHGSARARLARAHVREALADYAGALEDLESAAALARANLDPGLEAAALRALGGDVLVGLGRPSTDGIPYLEAGLDVARNADLGRQEVEILGRLAVIWTNRARFELASDLADRGLQRARELADDRALALALDCRKTVSAYTGDVPELERTLPELQRLLQQQGDLWLLQWATFESVVPALAQARWRSAHLTIDRALALVQRTGFPYGSLFVAHRAWLHRATGAYGRALEDGRQAVDEARTAGHPWWTSFAHAMLGWTLSDLGRHDEAIETLERGVAAAERDGMETYLVRAVSHLALARWRRGDREGAEHALREAERLLAAVTAPPGRAFLHGAHAYAAVARVQIARGDTDAALEVLEVVRGPAESVGWREVVVTDRLLRGRIRLGAGDPDGATTLLEEASAIAAATGLLRLRWESEVLLTRAADARGDASSARDHRQAATSSLEAMAGSLPTPGDRADLVDHARRQEGSGSETPPR